MKIEKGKLYYDNQLKCVIKAIGTGNRRGDFTDKIAVICNSKEDKLYIIKHYNLEAVGISKRSERECILINENYCCCSSYAYMNNYKTITIDYFKKIYPNDKKRDRVVKVGDVLKNEEGNFGVVDVSQIPQDSPEEIINNFKNGGFTFVNSQTDDLNGDEGNSFKEITNSIAELLEYKNTKYGNAVLEPLNIFNGKCKAGTRIDDKLSRIKNSKEGLRKNDVCDLIGYLILTCKENNWIDFSEFKD